MTLRDRWVWTWRDSVRLWIHNTFRRPWKNWRFRRRFYKQWIADGHRAEVFEMMMNSRLRREDIEWACRVSLARGETKLIRGKWR